MGTVQQTVKPVEEGLYEHSRGTVRCKGSFLSKEHGIVLVVLIPVTGHKDWAYCGEEEFTDNPLCTPDTFPVSEYVFKQAFTKIG